MKVPESINDFTVGQFISWNKTLKQQFENIEDREYTLLSIALGISVDEAMSIPHKKSLPLLIQLNNLRNDKPSEKVNKLIRVNGKIYEAILHPKDLRDLLNASQYTAFKEYTKSDPVEYMNLILPLLYTPYKFFRKPKISNNTQALSKEFLNARIGDVTGAVFFYTKSWEKLIEASQPYLKTANQEITDHMEEVLQAQEAGLLGTTAGTT